MGNLSFLFETILAIIIIYVPQIQLAINTRAIAIPHFMIPGVTYAMMIYFYDEFRKYWVRAGITRHFEPGGTKMLYDGWIARNTAY